MLIEALRGATFLTVEDVVGKPAWRFIKQSYGNHKHPTGIPYIDYVSGVAEILRTTGVDPNVIIAALTYPLVFDNKVTSEALEEQFGEEVLKLVEETLDFRKFEWHLFPPTQEQSESEARKEILRQMYLLAVEDFYTQDSEVSSSTTSKSQDIENQPEHLIKMLFALTTDIRSLVIILADRLHLTSLLHQHALDLPGERDYAKITIIIYASLANRLGMWQLKSELEDASFELLEPDQYKLIDEQLHKDLRQTSIKEIVNTVRKRIKASINNARVYNLEVYGRKKSVYSTYRKMKQKHLSFEDINDLLGIRIIVDKVEECYRVQKMLHETWQPLTDFYGGENGRDWIATPKKNRYQSLHTTILINDKVVEVQIRTNEMHMQAEYGYFTAYWRYKERANRDRNKPQIVTNEDRVWGSQLNALNQTLKDSQETVNPQQFFRNKIYVITPKGFVMELEAYSTLRKFASSIQIDKVGTYTEAKVDDRTVSFDYRLKNGEIVEFFTSQIAVVPTPSR